MLLSRRTKVGLAVGAVVIAVLASGYGLVGRRARPIVGTADPEEQHADEQVVAVKTIHPRRDPSFRLSVQQLAMVEPFYQAELRARASGVIRYVGKDIGDSVRAGELLVQIDVPDLEQEVLQKETIVEQRRREMLVSRANIRYAKAAVELAAANVEQKQTDVRQAAAARDYRVKRLARFKVLATRQAITPDVVDEQEQAALSAQAAEESARVAVRKARADLAEKEASLEAALADKGLKEALVAVALKDLDRTRAIAEYARLTAPFDGVVTRRNVDPGDFVQNATTGSGAQALVNVSRIDIVTVAVKLPDNAAAFVDRNTEVEIVIDDLPGVTIQGRVTRFAPAIEAGDRTMRVEVDLFNGSEVDYRRLAGKLVASRLAGLGAAGPCRGLTSLVAGPLLTHRDHKGDGDALPPRAPLPSGRHLLPGMTGYMRLLLDRFTDAYLVPSSAVFSRGGKQYILVVRDGMSQSLPVKVQVNDGRLAKIAIIGRAADTRTGMREYLQELTGSEEVIASRQLEVGDGQAVRAALQEW